MHLSLLNSYPDNQVFQFISKAVIQNGKENMVLETPYKMVVNF